MDTTELGQISKGAAQIYEEFFVPALFRDWAPIVSERAGIAPGNRVLDVACGTGVLAAAAHALTGHGGTVVGLDRNGGMLEIARRRPGINWREGRAEQLPFGDGSFDAVVSQFGLMFFEDRVAALTEMRRVLKSGGRLVVAVWDDIGNTPGYSAMANLLEDLFGADAANAIRAPYCLGDPAALRDLFAAAGIPGVSVERVEGVARFPSIDTWVHTDIRGWTLADKIDDAQYEILRAAAARDLKRFAAPGGAVEFPHGALIVSGSAQ